MKIVRSLPPPPRLAAGLRAGVRLTRETISGFNGHGGTRLAAITDHVLFSVFPLVIVTVAAAGRIAGQVTVRHELIDALVSSVDFTDESAPRSRGGSGSRLAPSAPLGS